MYEIDRFTIEEIGIPSSVLIERAAYSIVLDLQNILTSADNILIVAGSGNNGADAVALARMLHLLQFNVLLYVMDGQNYSHGMDEQLKIAKNIEVPITYEMNATSFEQASYIIDGLFGIGLSRGIEGHYRDIVKKINATKNNAFILSIDVPSGLSAITGTVFKPVVQADCTYTFGFLKKGMEMDAGKEYCGKIICCDIGYPKDQLEAHLSKRP